MFKKFNVLSTSVVFAYLLSIVNAKKCFILPNNGQSSGLGDKCGEYGTLSNVAAYFGYTMANSELEIENKSPYQNRDKAQADFRALTVDDQACAAYYLDNCYQYDQKEITSKEDLESDCYKAQLACFYRDDCSEIYDELVAEKYPEDESEDELDR